MKIGLFCEGSVDFPLVSALLERIAADRADVHWPLNIVDSVTEMRFRRGGDGQVVKAVRHLKRRLDEGNCSEYSLFVIVLDRASKVPIARIRRMIRGDARFVFGTAIQEIEAWWLGDRQSTLAWLRLAAGRPAGLRYWRNAYQAERDDDPKKTLDELTLVSPTVTVRYGRGNSGMASEFAGGWRIGALLTQIEAECPRGFSPFCLQTTAAMRRVRFRRRA